VITCIFVVQEATTMTALETGYHKKSMVAEINTEVLR